jgi:hypothetical protein
MKIDFIEEGNSIFAVSQNVEKNGKFYDELLWAEIIWVKEGIFIIWQDDWQNRIYSESRYKAMDYIRKEYSKHTPIVNGHVTDLE